MKKASKRPHALEPPSAVTSLPIRGHRVGRIVGLSAQGWLVECTLGATPIFARTTLSLSGDVMAAAASARQEALIVFESELADRPIVVGLLAPAPSPPADQLGAPQKLEQLEAIVDGRRVVVDARDEIVLRCGPASITLRRNGRIVVRGTYVETRAQGVNRIKGGSVQIN